MAKTARIEAEQQEEATDLAVMASVNPLEIFTDREKFSEFYKRIKEEVGKHVPDVSTERGRAAVRKLAFRVTKTKTTLDKQALRLTEEWRQQTAKVNEARRDIVNELDGLAKEVRRPLTQWEEAEDARVERCRSIIDGFKAAAVISIEDTSATVRQRGKEVYGTEIGDEFQDMADEAREAKDTAVATLGRAMNRLIQEEADRAELEQRRAADAAREEAAERDRVAAEQERQRVEYAKSIIQHIRDCGMGMIGGKAYPYVILLRELEEKVPPEIDETFGDLEAEARQVLAETIAKVKEAQEKSFERAREETAKEAREEAEREAARQAEERTEKLQREHDAAIAEEQRKREEAERIAREEREAREREEQERQAEADRLAAEKAAQAEADRKREANRAHRSRVQTAAKEAIMACGTSEEVAKAIVTAIVAGRIPAVTMSF